MAVTLKEQMVQDSTAFFNTDEFAVRATYQFLESGSSVETSVIFAGTETQVKGNVYAISTDMQSDQSVICVLASDVKTPQTGDQITVWESVKDYQTVWTVQRVSSTDGVVHKLLCVANEVAWR